MVVKGRRGNSKNPPVLSHEFVIQNHADIVACAAMVFVIGLIFQVTAPIATMFIAVQHNTTRNATEPPPAPYHFEDQLYTAGWKDFCCVFFYTLIAVVLHALVQEYALDKITRKLHLSKVKHSKFNDAGQLLAFALFTSFWGVHILQRESYLGQIALLWEGFPHTEMSFVLKFFMLIQVSYWLHWIPEIYFLRMKKEEIPQKLTMTAIYASIVSFAYVSSLSRVAVLLLSLHFIPEIFLNLARLFHFAEKQNASVWLFRVGNVVFITARFLSVITAVLTFWFGLEPFASQALRTVGLAVVCGIQSYLLFQFCIFHVKRIRANAAPTTAATKSPRKTKKSKDVSDLPEVDQNTRKQALKQKKIK